MTACGQECQTVFLPGTRIELVSGEPARGEFRHVLLDFDGTISLIREGWQEVMIPMMVDLAARTPGAESREQIEQAVREMVTRTTGKQTIHQMLGLCEAIRRRGGVPKDPLEYKHQYLERLLARIGDRREGLRNATIRPEEMCVAGAAEMLEALRGRGARLYCASGTDEAFMREEAKLLCVSEYFDGGLFGARDEYKTFSKRMLIERILAEHDLRGVELLTFGDGFVEIEETRAVGGVAVGVAADEKRGEGVDRWKRSRLIEAGADVIVPDFREARALVAYLFGNDDGPGGSVTTGGADARG